MGGPGSGRRPRAVERAAYFAGLSRVELEHVLLRAYVLGNDADVAAICNELAGRTWQNRNPYADADNGGT